MKIWLLILADQVTIQNPLHMLFMLTRELEEIELKIKYTHYIII